jgi:hypothetical protein
MVEDIREMAIQVLVQSTFFSLPVLALFEACLDMHKALVGRLEFT